MSKSNSNKRTNSDPEEKQVQTTDYEEVDLHFRGRMESLVPDHISRRIKKVLSDRMRQSDREAM